MEDAAVRNSSVTSHTHKISRVRHCVHEILPLREVGEVTALKLHVLQGQYRGSSNVQAQEVVVGAEF